MVNNTRVGGHLHGFVIDLENSLGYSIKFIHGIRGTGGEGWEGVCICVLGWTKVLKGMHRVETHSRSFPNECRGAQHARLRYSSFEGNLIIPALLMLLFCTILRRNYPARLNGQGLKSRTTFSSFLFSLLHFCLPFSFFSSSFSFPFLFFFFLFRSLATVLVAVLRF